MNKKDFALIGLAALAALIVFYYVVDPTVQKYVMNNSNS